MKWWWWSANHTVTVTTRLLPRCVNVTFIIKKETMNANRHQLMTPLVLDRVSSRGNPVHSNRTATLTSRHVKHDNAQTRRTHPSCVWFGCLQTQQRPESRPDNPVRVRVEMCPRHHQHRRAPRVRHPPGETMSMCIYKEKQVKAVENRPIRGPRLTGYQATC